MKKGILIILSGPSGVGKGTIRKKLFDEYPDLNLTYSISMTTREPREGETNGVDYFFVSEEEFHKNLLKNNFLEHASFVGHNYGTPKDYVESLLNEGKNVLLEIDIRGAKQVMKKAIFDDSLLSIFLTAPSLRDIEARIRGRRSETEEQLKERLNKAKKEMHLSYLYDYVVVNDKLDAATEKIANIIREKISKQ